MAGVKPGIDATGGSRDVAVGPRDVRTDVLRAEPVTPHCATRIKEHVPIKRAIRHRAGPDRPHVPFQIVRRAVAHCLIRGVRVDRIGQHRAEVGDCSGTIAALVVLSGQQVAHVTVGVKWLGKRSGWRVEPVDVRWASQLVDRLGQPQLQALCPHRFRAAEHRAEARVGLGQLTADLGQRRHGDGQNDVIEISSADERFRVRPVIDQLRAIRRRRPTPPVPDALDRVIPVRAPSDRRPARQLDGVDDRPSGHQTQTGHLREEPEAHPATPEGEVQG